METVCLNLRCPCRISLYRPLRLTLSLLPLYQVLRLCTQGSHEIAQVLFNHVLQRLPYLVLQDTPSRPEAEHIRKRVEDLAPTVL